MTKSDSYVAKLMKPVAVIGVKRAKLMSLHQDQNETFRRLPPVYAAKHKPAISLQSVSVTVGKRM